MKPPFRPPGPGVLPGVIYKGSVDENGDAVFEKVVHEDGSVTYEFDCGQTVKIVGCDSFDCDDPDCEGECGL